MKRPLLFICFLVFIINVQAQTLYGLTFNGGQDNGGALIKFIPATNNLTVAKSFEVYAANPYATTFIQASDGKLYGMTAMGGNGSIYNSGPAPTSFGNGTYGVIFSFDPSTSTYKMLKAFDYTNGAQPLGSLVKASNGNLYGMTSLGGSSGYGVIFSFDPSTSTFTKLKDFDGSNGRYPYGSLVQADDGKLYGVTSAGGSGNGSYGYGVIFSFDPSTSAFTKLKDFDGSGANPTGSLVKASNGKLYGMTQGGIFSFDPSTSTYTLLKGFIYPDIDGGSPRGSLIQASDGKLYGMTQAGGSYGDGVIFSFDPSSSTYTKLADFNSTIGASPYGSLMQASNGKLYGMTQSGGINGAGVIFSFDPSSHTYTKLKNFDSDNWNSLSPHGDGSLMQAGNGKLYGMTCFGGSTNQGNLNFYSRGNGVIFSFDPSTSIYTKLMNLDSNSSGTWPSGTVMQASNGKLYGMAMRGGSNGWGVIFSFEPDNSTYTKLIDFDGINGGEPHGSLVQANDGKLYGITNAGGSYGYGVIFSFDPSTSTYTKLIDFDGTNGFGSFGSLTQASDGKLYFMEAAAGASMYSFDLTTSTTTRIFFGSTTASGPKGSLIQATDGKLYGMAFLNRDYDEGVIFSFDPFTSTYTNLYDFHGTNGRYPFGSLTQANDGKLYGMTYAGGSYDYGVIFSFDPSTSTYAKLKDFESTNGAHPRSSLMQASDGKLYGMTAVGGSNNLGVIFSFDPSSSSYKKLKDLDGTNGDHPDFDAAFIEISNREGNDIIPAVSIAITSGTNPTCAGTNVTFTATPTNGGATPNYQWKLNGANVGTNSNTYQNATLANGAKVACVMTSSMPGASPTTALSNEIAMTVNASPTLIITAIPGNTFCPGTIVTFVATPVNAGTINSYQWKLNGTNVGVNSNTYENPGLANGNKISCVLTSNATCGNQVPVTSNEITMSRARFGSCLTIKYPNTRKSFVKTYHLREGNTDGNKVQNKLAEGMIQFSPRIVSPAIPDLHVHPNPANQNSMITFYLEASARISIDVFNIAGQQFGIIENKVLSSGNQTIPWNTEKVAAGVYFIRLRTVKYSTAKKVIVIH